MDIITTIKTNRYTILEQIYSMLTPINFTNNAKLSGKSRYILCNKFKQLERLIQTTNQQWWDQLFLSQYLDAKVSPRGLRVMKDCPTFLDSESSKEWANIAEFCTAKWMQILITHRNNRFEKYKTQLQVIIDDISSHQLSIPSSWLEVLKNNTKQDENLLINTKTGKFKRDIDDYNSDRIFSWNKKHPSQSTCSPTQTKVIPFSLPQVSSNPPPPPLMSLRFPHHFVPHRQHRVPLVPLTSIREKTPTPKHSRGTYKTKSFNKDKNNELITALNHFYNRSINPHIPTPPIAPNKQLSPTTCSHSTDASAPSTSNQHMDSIDQEPSNSTTIPTVTSNISIPSSSFLGFSPPLTPVSRKRKLIEEAAEEGEENDHSKTLKYQKL